MKASQASVEALTGNAESDFFTNIVDGHEALPFPEYLAFVGLAVDTSGIHEQANASAQQIIQRRKWLQASPAAD